MRRTPARRAAVAATVLALLLTGCSATDDGRDADGTIRLRFQSLAWQKESVDANKQLVKEWNAAHPGVQVDYVQGSWDNVHDQLLTSFEGGEAPDIIHDASDDLADFAYGGYLADLRTLLPDRLKADIPEQSWRTTTFDGGTYGVPFLQEPRVLIANSKILKASGVRIPTPEQPWSWAEFRKVSKELTGKDRYGVAWPLKEPVSVTLNLGLSGGGQLFHREPDGRVELRFEEGDKVVTGTIHDQVNTDRSAARTALGMGGSDALPGFFGGRYAMLPLGFAYRQQIVEQAPEGFEWTVLPAPAGSGGRPRGSARRPSPSPRTARTRRRPSPSSTSCCGHRTWSGWPGATGCCPPAPPPSPTPPCTPPSTAGPPGPRWPGICARRPRRPYAATPSGRTRWRPPRSRSTTAARSAPMSCANGWSTTATGCWPATSAEEAPETARRDVSSRLWWAA